MQNTYHRHDISNEIWELLKNPLPGRKGTWEVMPEIIGNSSTRFSGFCEQGHRGEIFRQTMETGRISTEDSVIGETEVYGKNSLKSSLRNQTLNG